MNKTDFAECRKGPVAFVEALGYKLQPGQRAMLLHPILNQYPKIDFAEYYQRTMWEMARHYQIGANNEQD